MPTLDEARNYIQNMIANPGRGPAPGSDETARGILDDPAIEEDFEGFVDAVAQYMSDNDKHLNNGQVIAAMIAVLPTFTPEEVRPRGPRGGGGPRG